MASKPLIRVWRSSGFVLKVYDLERKDCDGKWMLGYKFYDQGKLIFKGDDFHCSPLHAVDSKSIALSILHFLAMRPGDTDREYFESYTPAQIAWCDDRAEDLQILIAGHGG